jgi:asparagine synthase (glutamine-hydrolysing)
MCGIVGLISAEARPADRAHLEAMRDTLSHRGPDDLGVWWSPDGRVGLGHRRLAIIDLSPAGHQPMPAAGGRLQIVYNGEIYNYRELRQRLEGRGRTFRSSSDTEVILEAFDAWGGEALTAFNGMLALALYDLRSEQLWLARDRAGEKPLFYWRSDDRLYFASELKALLAHPDVPRTLDVEALDFYLAYGYVPGDRCILRGIRKLPQGHRLTLDLRTNAVTVEPYWALPTPGQEARDERELTEELEVLMLESVRLRLTTADVPVGILLSGGLDSSLVTALAARVSTQPVRTFTVTFPGHAAFDEAAHAQLVASAVGARHTELPLEPDSADLLGELARHFDEPIADSSMVPTLQVSKLIRRHATVALGGDGGDELFAGYPHYDWIQRQAQWRRWLPAGVRRMTSAAASRLPLGTRGRNHLIGLVDGTPWSIAHVNMYFDARTRARLLRPEIQRALPGPALPEQFKAGQCDDRSPLAQAMAVDFRTYLVDDLLVKVDRASMAASLEVRCPWLDHRVIEFAFSQVPDTLRIGNGERKILLRRLARRLLPAAFDVDRKQGFSLPLDAWFNGPWGAALREILAECDPAVFTRSVIDELLTSQERGRGNMQRLYALAFFELWRREHRIAIA